ncbi:non-structural maintenance of chromosomes element 1-like protein [Chlorella sorokiniana]|uniref:Non-structural maintenance of chromosomes element 1 homolog n=1 Tax=Chlorella sorokiniana TaxID=3076 RepID=A0A2P6TKJ1_CHLSO|nr:non-structural maintenance of chromosomes element 1-like protein [Chlorella sorokiniana]|eukprot:PRW44587.1 non-structural maintenance of chromosomes element 1-like protein [Chlorella sorokiniana]
MAPKRRQSAGGAAAAAAAAAAAEGGVGGGNLGPAYRHCFLQAMMTQQYLKESDAKKLYRQITSAADDANYFHFVADVNQQLQFAQLELRRVKYLGDGEYYLGFVNREADEPSKRSVKYRGAKDGKPDTRITAYFKALLEQIATSGTAEQGLGYVSTRDALNISLAAAAAATQGEDEEAVALRQQAEEIRKLGMKEREAVLGELTMDGWLAHMPGKAGCYTLGPRTFLELGQYICGLDLPPAAEQALGAVLAR